MYKILNSKYLSQFKEIIKLQRPYNYGKSFNYVNTRNFFQTSCNFMPPVFKDTENVYAYNLLQTIPLKNSYIYTDSNCHINSESDFNNRLNHDWRSKSATEIVDCFKSVLNYCVDNNVNVSDHRFDKLVDGLMDRIQDLTDDNLSDILICMSKFPLCDSYTSHNFHDIWSALDDACCWKLSNWSIETMFTFADYWYRLNLGKLCNYSVLFVEKMTGRAKNLTKLQLIHLFFFINVCRKRFVDFNFEEAIERHISKLNANELAIIAMGFFKSQTPIRLKYLLSHMMTELKSESTNAHEITISALLKVLRYSSHVLLVDQLMDLLDALVPEIDRLSNVCCVHIALLGTTLQFFHGKSLQKVTEKILADIDKPEVVRLKDMERLLLPLTMFNFTPSTGVNVFDAVFKEVHNEERCKEFVQYHRSLAGILNFLSLQKRYSYHLMNEILNEERISELYGKNPKYLPRDIFSLDVCIDVECPEYSGNRLDKQFRHRVTKWFVEYTPTWNQSKKLKEADQFVLDVTETVAKIVDGHTNLRSDHVLPNFVKSDIIICSENGKFVNPTGFQNYQLGDVMKPPNANLTWYAIVPVNWNACIRNTSTPLGLINMKRRLLEAIGYKPILVIWNEFMPLGEKDKIDYIKNKIS